MKTLQLVRHAKSAWDVPNLTDLQRGLKKRGLRESPQMGAALTPRPLPDCVYVSPARRAQLTLKGLSAGWPQLLTVPSQTDEALYTFSFDALLAWLSSRSASEGAVMCVSHNPGMTELVNFLMGENWLDNLPTAGYVEMLLHIDRWGEVMQGCAEVTYSLFPRELTCR